MYDKQELLVEYTLREHSDDDADGYIRRLNGGIPSNSGVGSSNHLHSEDVLTGARGVHGERDVYDALCVYACVCSFVQRWRLLRRELLQEPMRQ